LETLTQLESDGQVAAVKPVVMQQAMGKVDCSGGVHGGLPIEDVLVTSVALTALQMDIDL
jgi:hypothetical protein